MIKEQLLRECTVMSEDRLSRKFSKELMNGWAFVNPVIFKCCLLKKWVDYTRLQ